jgi:hypothetical protein
VKNKPHDFQSYLNLKCKEHDPIWNQQTRQNSVISLSRLSNMMEWKTITLVQALDPKQRQEKALQPPNKLFVGIHA